MVVNNLLILFGEIPFRIGKYKESPSDFVPTDGQQGDYCVFSAKSGTQMIVTESCVCVHSVVWCF